MASDSEFRSYGYIQSALSELGWDTKSPTRDGDVYWQREFYNHDQLLTTALDMKSPENIVLVPYDNRNQYWVIEAKKDPKKLDEAVSEAIDYSEEINAVYPASARFASGVAGSPDDTFYVCTKFFDGKEWREVRINDYETSGFLSQQQCSKFLESNTPAIDKTEESYASFIARANAINTALDSNEIPEGERPRIMAALLLAIAKDPVLPLKRDARAMTREINGSVEDILAEHGKKELAEVLKLALPMTAKNHEKYRKALAEALQILRNMNIRSAINSGDDALGQFYETFLRYTKGAQKMGIVLTPRHITRFAAEVLHISQQDRVYDPTCGTGGFLVAAMDLVKTNSRKGSGWEKFQNQGLFGVEQRDDVFGLAVVNMIFRGDGKSHVYDGNCFEHEFWLRDGEVSVAEKGAQPPQGAERPFTKILMNPPFKLKSNSEPEFVDHALSQTAEGGTLFAVLPSVVIAGKKKHKQWRKEFLKRHTLKAVIKFETRLFYPVQEATYGLIAVAHKPHKAEKKVFWAEMFDAQHTPRPSKMKDTSRAKDNMEILQEELKRFMRDKPCEDNLPNEIIVEPVGETLDFSPELRLPRTEPKLHPAIIARKASLNAAIEMGQAVKDPNRVSNLKIFEVETFVEKIHKSPLQNIKSLDTGSIPVVSATYYNNGIAGWFDVEDDKILQNCITISKTSDTHPCEAYWHPYKFSAIATAIVLEPTKDIIESEEAILYLCEAITRDNRYKYHYAKPVQLEELKVFLPAKPDGTPDLEAMAVAVKEQL